MTAEPVPEPPPEPPPEPLSEPAAEAQVSRWANVLGSVIAPATLLSALLFYFGYVSSRAQYDYFGIDVDVIGLSTQDYVGRSPQPLLVPLLVFVLLGAALIALHAWLRLRTHRPGFATAVRVWVGVGLVVLGVGLMLLFAYPLVGSWSFYPLVTPLVLALGCAIVAYGLGTLRSIARATRSGPRPALGVVVLLWAAVAAGAFWATATVAQWSGLGLAEQQARHLSSLPSVIVDTQERLFLPAGSHVTETALPVSSDTQKFRYRYWGLRLLIVGNDRLFLVPNTWSSGSTALVVPLDGSSRLQFQFRDVAP